MIVARLDKYVSVACGVSRSDARDIVRKGSVSVNGVIIRSVDAKISDTDNVSVNGTSVCFNEFVYLVMNKPRGILSASSDKRARTVVDIVPSKYKHYELFPVGRLDKDTTGLLLITNDGNFSHKVISPRSNIDKQYEVVLDGIIVDEHIKRFEEGMTLADGTKCLPAKLRRVTANVALVTIKEGKYHQIKRMFGVVGLGVNELKRLSIGKLLLPADLEEGNCRELTADELKLLF